LRASLNRYTASTMRHTRTATVAALVPFVVVAVAADLDGELRGHLPMSFRIEPTAIRVIR
jgi:diacylglycerol kinase family enzyme